MLVRHGHQEDRGGPAARRQRRRGCRPCRPLSAQRGRAAPQQMPERHEQGHPDRRQSGPPPRAARCADYLLHGRPRAFHVKRVRYVDDQVALWIPVADGPEPVRHADPLDADHETVPGRAARRRIAVHHSPGSPPSPPITAITSLSSTATRTGMPPRRGSDAAASRDAGTGAGGHSRHGGHSGHGGHRTRTVERRAGGLGDLLEEVQAPLQVSLGFPGICDLGLKPPQAASFLPHGLRGPPLKASLSD